MQISANSTNNIPNISLLDIPQLDLTSGPTGPLSSTPKRVVISDRIREHVYPNESLPNTRSKSLKPSTRASATLEGLYYIDPRYHIDDRRKDPSYKPPKTKKQKSKPPEAYHRTQPKRILPKQSLIPRFSLRSQPTSSRQPEMVPKSILKSVSEDIRPTDANNNTLKVLPGTSSTSKDINLEDPMKNIQTRRNTQPKDTDDDHFMSFSDNSTD